MSVLNPESRAAPPQGAAFAYHRTSRLAEWLRRGNGFRLALSMAAGLFGVLLRNWAGGLLFPVTPAVSLAAGLLFGWVGLAGTTAGQLAAVWILRDSFSDALIFSLAFSLIGAAGWTIFQLRPQARPRPPEPALLPLDPRRPPSWEGWPAPCSPC